MEEIVVANKINRGFIFRNYQYDTDLGMFLKLAYLPLKLRFSGLGISIFPVATKSR